MEFIKVGKHVINVNAIAHVNLESFIAEGLSRVEITMLSTKIETRKDIPSTKSEVLIFTDEEADIVRNYFEKLG